MHHFACLAGYGAEAINPYLAFETLVAMKGDLPQKLDDKEIVKRYIKSIDKGLLKVMSKMGISTYQSYCGAQIFDAVGLKSDFVDTYFTGTATRIEGVGLDRDRRGNRAPPSHRLRRLADLSQPCSMSAATMPSACAARIMSGPPRRWRRCSTRCAAIRYDSYRALCALMNEQSEQLLHHPRPVPASRPPRRTAASRCRSRRSSPPQTSCAASHRRHVVSARSRARPTPRSPSP